MITFRELSQKFLVWCEQHQSKRTTEWYTNYTNQFLSYLGDGANVEAMAIKPYQVQDWIDSHGNKWGVNYAGGALVAMKRIFNWSEQVGYTESNPISKLRKPPIKRREAYYRPTDFDELLQHIHYSDPFLDFVRFMWATGCRPQEARAIEHRHVDIENRRIKFPKDESKGKRHPRRILLNDAALEIINRLIAKNPEGHVFRNSRGEPWTKYAICERFYRIQKKTGKKLTSYALRHGFGTRKLKEGHGHLQIANCMGHVDGSMLAKIYSHIDEDEDHLREVLD